MFCPSMERFQKTPISNTLSTFRMKLSGGGFGLIILSDWLDLLFQINTTILSI